MVFTIINKKKYFKFYKLGIICGILHQEYLKMRVKKLNIFIENKLEHFNSIDTFFSSYKNLIFHYTLKKLYGKGEDFEVTRTRK